MSEKKITANQLIKYEKDLTSNKYFDYISHDFDDYSSIGFSEEEATNLVLYLRKLSTGAVSFIPMTCTDKCFARHRCPLFQIGKHPVGKSCYIETQLLKEWIIRYMEEYSVDPNNFTEVGYCNELAEIEVLQVRLNLALARPENAELVIDQMVGVGREGTPIIQKMISPFLEQKQTLTKRKSQIIKLMVGDRQEKYKKEAALKQKDDTDPSMKMAKMRKQLETLQRGLDTLPQTKELPLPNSVEKLTDILTPDDIIGSDE